MVSSYNGAWMIGIYQEGQIATSQYSFVHCSQQSLNLGNEGGNDTIMFLSPGIYYQDS